MTTEVTVTLPNEVYHRAEWLAKRTGRTVADVVAEAADMSLRPLGSIPDPDPPLSEWSDEEVVAAANAMMLETEDQRMSVLLQKQQAGTLTNQERPELQVHFERYQVGQLRKAQGMHEAVKRGLVDAEQHTIDRNAQRLRDGKRAQHKATTCCHLWSSD